MTSILLHSPYASVRTYWKRLSALLSESEQNLSIPDRSALRPLLPIHTKILTSNQDFCMFLVAGAGIAPATSRL